jgi:HprK-related kinase A
LKVSDLSLADLAFRLRTPGLSIRTGAFATRLQTSIQGVAEGIRLLYGEYPIAEQNGFADFHVSLARPRGLRRWFKPQVLFLVDGYPAFKPLPLDHAFPTLEWGMNWCVSSHAHRYLVIHAAVIEKHGCAAILPAPPGSGKSTLCAALVNRGWRLLSDELTLVRIDDGMIVPVPRPVSLKNASIDIMRRYAADAVFSFPVADTVKGTVAYMKAPSESIARASETARPAWLIFPKYQPDSAALLQALPRARAFMQAADNSFNYSVLGPRGFDVLAHLIDMTQCYEFTYSVLDEAVETFDALPW